MREHKENAKREAGGGLPEATRELTLEARAKLNLFLEVRGRRDDGYHDIVTVFQEIDLADTLTAVAAEPGVVELSCDLPTLPGGDGNLAVKAARLLQRETGSREGIRFSLSKRIPVGAGLGGGSSDAAAALRLANQLWGLGLDRGALSELAAKLGADVTFFLWGGTCLGEGRGEVITPLADAVDREYLLVLPNWEIATAAAYAALDGRKLGTRAVAPFLAALESGDTEAIARASFNRFEAVVFALEPRQRRLRETLSASGVRVARLSGSGAAMWCLPTAAEEKELSQRLQDADTGRVIRVYGQGADPSDV